MFKAGNSYVVAIPKALVEELGIRVGQKVRIQKIPDRDDLVIETKPTKKTSPKRIEAEFKKWLDSFLEEDGKLLDELAHR